MGRPKKQFCVNGHDTFICGRDPLNYCCIDCETIRNREWKANNKDKILEYNEKYREEHKEEIKIQKKIWRKNNKQKIKEQKQKWDAEHKEEVKEKKRQWNLKNKKKINKQKAESNKKKLETDFNFKLAYYLRTRLRLAIKRNQKVGSAVKDLGCSVEFLKDYIEDKFYGNMTWDNYGTYWQLDHITPLWKFNLTDRDQFLKAVHYTNLQPLTIPDHKKKTSLEAAERASLKQELQK